MLAVVLAGAFMAGIDVTIVNVALPAIRVGLGASNSVLEWVLSGYSLAFGLALVPAGRVGDYWGHKRVFVTGLVLFTLASVACGLAQNGAELVAARVMQGLAAGIFTPSIPATIRIVFAQAERGKAFSLYGAVWGVSAAIGPTLCGLIILVGGETDGWRWVFLVNLPVGILAVIAALRLLPETERAVRHNTDAVGLFLLTAALLLLLVPLVEGQSLGWPAWTAWSMGASASILVLLALWEVREERRKREPLIPPRVVSHPDFAVGAVISLVFFAAFTSVFFIITIVWQIGYGRGALETGLSVLPWSVASFVGASVSHRLAAVMGRGVLLLGAGAMTVGLVGIYLVLRLEDGGPSAWAMALPFLLGGLGTGFFIAPNQAYVLSTVSPQQAGAAAGVLNTAQRIGSAVGIALIGTVLFGSLSIAPGPNAMAIAFSHAAQNAILVNIGLIVLCFLLTLLLPATAVRKGSASG